MVQDPELRGAYDILGNELFKHEVQYPRWPYIQPIEDTQADALEIAHNLNSPRRIAARKGLEYPIVVQETCEDRSALISCALDAAAELNKHPYIAANPEEKVQWREIAHPSLPDGIQMALQTGQQQESDKKTEAKAQSNAK